MPESKPKPEQVQLLKDWKRAMNIYIYIIDPHVIQKYISIHIPWHWLMGGVLRKFPVARVHQQTVWRDQTGSQKKEGTSHGLFDWPVIWYMSHWFLCRPQWFLASSTSPQSSSMNPRLIQEMWASLLFFKSSPRQSTPQTKTSWQVTSKNNFDFVLRWVSVSSFVGQPPTKKEVQADIYIYIYIITWIVWDISDHDFYRIILINTFSTMVPCNLAWRRH